LAVSTMIWVRSLRLRYLKSSQDEPSAAHESVGFATA
jgi:hypothetical protein